MSDSDNTTPQQPTKAHEVSPGVISMMRVQVRKAVNVGIFLSVAGVALAGALAIIGSRFELVPVALALIAGGPALISTALAWKAWQAQAE